MNLTFSNNYYIKIPKNLQLYLTKNFLIIKTNLGIRFIKLKIKILICHNTNCIVITPFNITNLSLTELKLKIFQKTFEILLKKSFKELQLKFKQRLKLIGVGFRAIVLNYYNTKILQLKLGFSHQLYFYIPKEIEVITPKYNRLLIFGYSEKRVNNFVLLLRTYKFPDPYKGKGILYDTEKIKLKEGKKL